MHDMTTLLAGFVATALRGSPRSACKIPLSCDSSDDCPPHYSTIDCDGRRARQSCTASAGAQAGAQHAPQGSESAQRRVPGFGPSRNSRDPTRCEGGAREQTFVPRQATPGARRPR